MGIAILFFGSAAFLDAIKPDFPDSATRALIGLIGWIAILIGIFIPLSQKEYRESAKKFWSSPWNVAVWTVIVLGFVYASWSYMSSIYKVEPVADQSTAQTNMDFETKSISSAYIYGPELNKVKVYLYAADEKKTIATDVYCGSPTKGAEVRTGNYSLIVDPATATSDNPGGISDLDWKGATLDIGAREFVKDTAWDGKIAVEMFGNDYKRFIVLQKYGTCNGIYMQVFGYDLSKGQLVQYGFIKQVQDSAWQEEVFTSSYKKSASGNLVTVFYDQTIGKEVTTEWVFDSSKNVFRSK